MTSSEINMSHLLAKWAVAPVQKKTRFYLEILSSTFTRPLFFLSVILQWSSSQLEPPSRLDHKHNMTLHNDDTVFVMQQYYHMRFHHQTMTQLPQYFYRTLGETFSHPFPPLAPFFMVKVQHNFLSCCNSFGIKQVIFSASLKNNEKNISAFSFIYVFIKYAKKTTLKNKIQ